MRLMAGSGAVIWLFLSILQGFLVFSGVIPPSMELLSVLMGSNSIGFFLIFLYFTLRRKPRSHMGSDYNKSERTTLAVDENGQRVEIDEKSSGSAWERWATSAWAASTPAELI